MNGKRHITPLDEEALVLVPGLQYARALIDIAIRVSRRSALELQIKRRQAKTRSPEERH